ncbi:SpaH/EbpB family LPXTG-anchored major pilin [Leucobacter sp. W1478]|uniref:SpaH/EbpB family LPXTG-anchored major pilin n=1 Tax=Leucobacter sp. W1478 TaxID=3439065 RepID=UPI003F2C2FFA
MNHENRGRFAKRALAALGATALLLIGTVTLSSAASADEHDAPVVGPSVSNITGTTGTLTIHKHAGDPGEAGNGQVITDPAKIAALGAGLEGVQFSIERVTYDGSAIDLTTATGWDVAQSATVARVMGAQDGFGKVAPPTATATTLAGGIAVIPNLPYGMYLVTETSAGPNQIVTPIQPFLVTVPYPQASDSTWLYDVHVYPKNKLNTTNPEKTVAAPDGVVIGSTVVWTITAPIPELGTGGTYNKFVITDTLDPRLTLTGAVVKIDDTELVPITHYSVSGNVVITLTPAGLALLAGADNVIVEASTTVDSLGEGETGGLIPNHAIVNVNDSVRETGYPQTNWGPLKVIKKAAVAPNNTLQGAEFTLHETKNGPALAEAGTLVTDANGEIVVDGLWVGSNDTLSKTYWLQETKAPTGYVLPEGDGAWTQVAVNAGAASTVVPVVINNTQQGAPRLPLTGSTGTAAFMIGGIALLLTAGGVGLATARRKQGVSKQ